MRESVEVPAPVMDAGLKPAVTPLGAPEALRATAELNPLAAVVVSVAVPVAPCARLMDALEAAKVKLGGAAMVSATVVVWIVLPEVALTVMV